MIEVLTINGERIAYPDHRVLSIRKNTRATWQLTLRSLINPSETKTIEVSQWRRVPTNEWM